MRDTWQELPVSGRLFESVRWLPIEECFQWVDILESKVYRWWEVGDRLEVHQIDAEFTPLLTPAREAGVQLLAGRDGVYRYAWGGIPEPWVVLPVGRFGRINDGIVGPDGDLWVGSMSLTPSEHPKYGKLWRVHLDGTYEEVLSSVGISNGIVWGEGGVGYYVDSAAGTVDEIRVAGSGLERRTICTINPPGEPDGLYLQGDRLWMAVWGAGQLVWLDRSTGDMGAVPIPAVRPSSVAFSPRRALVTTGGSGDGALLAPDAKVFTCAIIEGSLVSDF